MVTPAVISEETVLDALGTVIDPEIPAISITDLGMIERVATHDGSIEVDLLPTFVGCPATDMIRRDVARALAAIAGDWDVKIRFVWDPPWTTDRITPAGRDSLKGFGIAPPPMTNGGLTLLQISVPCPYCGSTATEISAEFGPTPCRTIRYCTACNNPFEGFKTKQI